MNSRFYERSRWNPITNLFFVFICSNRKFAELYTEDLNGNTEEEIDKKSFKILDAWDDLYQMEKKENKSKCVKSFERKAVIGLEVFEVLNRMTSYNWSPFSIYAAFRPDMDELIETLKKLMEKFTTRTGGQTFAFRHDNASEVYWHKEINVPREFKFLKKGSDQIGPKTKSMLTYEQFLPFNNQNHDNRGCVTAKDLPRFYKKKGKELISRQVP